MSYATWEDIQARITRDLSEDDKALCTTLLSDAGVIIDTFNVNASTDAKLVVSCRMVIRAIGDDNDIPMGATQGSMSALGYSQSWTMSGGASVGELYLSKLDKELLGYGNKIGSYSPVEELVGRSI
jgi:hypothetical protein